MSEAEVKETKKRVRKAKETKAETPVPVRPGSVVLYSIAGQRIRFENIIGMFKTIDNGQCIMELTSTDGRYRVIPVQPGMIFEWQPEE
jgi:hypothetical protein